MSEINRKLASIRKIESIEPIEGADNIELAHVDGWQCVVKKGDFKAGELCVYFEIDSFLPIRPEFEFLRKSSYKKMGDKEGFRLKTIRLRGKLSQGLVLKRYDVFSLRELYSHEDPDGADDFLYSFDGKDGYADNRLSNEGLDLTEELGVIKYDPPIPACLEGKVNGNFPSFLRKTDQERVQNIWNKVKDSKESFEVTIKLDGTSCTYYMKDGVFGVCSRNLELEESEDNTLWKLAREMNLKDLMFRYGNNIAIQGEVIGEGIQSNPEGIKGQRFYAFDIWDIDSQKYLGSYARTCICMNFDILHAPILYDKLTLENFNCLDDLLELADGKSLRSDIREGIVFKSNHSGLTFKVISNQYLLRDKS